MRFRYGFALPLLILTVQSAFAVDINAPLDDTPTIASEIRRGFDAALRCDADHPFRPVAFSHCTSAAGMADEQRHPNHAPFGLGLYLNECVLDALTIKGPRHGANVEYVRNDLAISYQGFRALQKELGLSDEQIAIALAAPHPPAQSLLDQLHDWERNPPKESKELQDLLQPPSEKSPKR